MDLIFKKHQQTIPSVRPAPEMAVTVKECGNLVEVRYMKNTPHGGTIKKLNADFYIDKRTGELKEFEHTNDRSESKETVAQSLRKLRDIINSNLTDPRKALWVTLTYRENMTDAERLYEDFRRFWLRFRYRYPQAEYIAAAEPQARGAWHLHCLFFFPKKAPFIPNKEMESLWRQGFTKTKSLKGIDNPGLYLTAYLGDMELSEALSAGATGRYATEKLTTDEQGQKKKKAIIKGGRLHLYPVGFRLFRCSRGIKRPEIVRTTEERAQRIVGKAELKFEKTVAIRDNNGETVNIINYRQYMRKGGKKNSDYE